MRLNWASGSTWSEHSPLWLCSDVVDYGQHHVGDIRDGLPWEDGTFEAVVTVHSLHQFPPAEVLDVLTELHRVTSPGGYLRVIDRDPLRGFTAYVEQEDWLGSVISDEHEATPEGKLCRWLTWHGEVRSLWTPPSLFSVLGRAGYRMRTVARFGVPSLGPHWITELDDREPESFYVEALA